MFKGEKANWRSSWKRFVDALARIDILTVDECLTLLLDSLKDPAAQTVVSRAIRDGQTFIKVEKMLKELFNRPQEVFMDAAKEFLSGPKIAHNVRSLTYMVDSVENCVSVFNQYWDGTITQLITAILDTKMECKIRED